LGILLNKEVYAVLIFRVT